MADASSSFSVINDVIMTSLLLLRLVIHCMLADFLIYQTTYYLSIIHLM